MIRYFKKSFVRYLAYGLAIALLSFIFGLFKVKAEELEYITPTNTSLHTYISVTNIGASSATVYYNSASYREITGTQGQYTFTGTQASPKTIMKLAYNVFGNFQVNNSYKIRWEAKFPNGVDISKYTCSMGSYDNNTAYPPWSLSSCEIKRSNSGYIIMEGTITIERGQYVTIVITPKLGLDINYTYDITEPLLPENLDYNFTLSYGTPQILKVLPISVAIGGLASDINNVESAVNGVKNSVDNVNSGVNNLNSSINNDNVSEAENKATDFFNNFTTNTHGLTGIITAPLNAISSITSSTCSPLVLPLPFVDEDLTLPCMRPIYEEFFGDFMSLYDIVVLGIVSYWIVVRIFSLVKDFKNPEHDEVEVMEL